MTCFIKVSRDGGSTKLTQVFNCLVCFAIPVTELPKNASLKQLRECKSMREGLLDQNFYARCFTRMGIQTYTRFHKQQTYEHMKAWRAQKGIAGPGLSAYPLYWAWNPLHTGFMRVQIGLYNRGLLGLAWGIGLLAGLGAVGYRSVYRLRR